MSRHEADREDLLREATALVERAELAVGDWPGPVVAGFRRDGSASFFFGSDPVYQFNSLGELRRAFVAGQLVKAERGRPVALDRHRTRERVELVRQDLSASATNELIANVASRLDLLRAALASGDYSLVGQVPPEADVVGRVQDWLTRRISPIIIANSPHAR